jgi:hypothetical protein
MTHCWSTAFRRAPFGPAVFEVLPGRQESVLTWAARQDVPTVRHHNVHAPDVEAWAVLDGGITSVRGYGVTTLPAGVRVVGYRALRLLMAEFDLAGPVSPFDGESTVLDAVTLRRLHRTTPRDAIAVEQAELLGTCQDAVMMRWVATTLLADGHAAAALRRAR